MDLYLINGHDGISLPEMIDWDIKLCDSEISEEVGISNFVGVGYDLPPLEIEEEANPLWTQSYSANSNSSFELDFLGEGGSSLMVNPSSVMPFVSSHRSGTKIHDNEEETTVEKNNDDNASFTTPIKNELNSSHDNLPKVEIVDHLDVEEEEDLEEEEGTDVKVNVEEVCEQAVTFDHSKNVQEIISLPIEFVNVNNLDSNFIEVTQSKKVISHKRHVVPCVDDGPVKSYPKPAYSYSCLIAMALKNSLTGSLPVSEIYSFMCHHFPYFKTAPNGWKNSVRHNLSLNKCFEKIEKPPGNGASGSQRKGCLWAMNPAKIMKMDEEVAKWSRKDPSAIKKAMVCPDNLELLERGEMKDFTAFEEEEVEEDTEEAKEEEEEDVDDFVGDAEDERISPIDDDSEDEMSRVPPSLQPFEPKFAQFNRHKMLTKSRDLSEKSIDFKSDMDFDVGDNVYELEVSGNRTIFGVDESTPVYAVDPVDDNILIELPMVKRPRVQGNYIYQPVINMKRHNISGFRSIKIQSP
uniref:Fork-head domain-containing protein n=1 Tax=Cuerna arida TaxID=1464854 RepID=A0A1B6GRF1_9HEMI